MASEPSDPIARVRALVKEEKSGRYVYKTYDDVIKSADIDDVRAYLATLEGTKEATELLYALAQRSRIYGDRRFRGLLAEILCSSVVAWVLGR